MSGFRSWSFQCLTVAGLEGDGCTALTPGMPVHASFSLYPFPNSDPLISPLMQIVSTSTQAFFRAVRGKFFPQRQEMFSECSPDIFSVPIFSVGICFFYKLDIWSEETWIKNRAMVMHRTNTRCLSFTDIFTCVGLFLPGQSPDKCFLAKGYLQKFSNIRIYWAFRTWYGRKPTWLGYLLSFTCSFPCSHWIA